MPSKFAREMMCRVQIEHATSVGVNTTQVTFRAWAAEPSELFYSAVKDALRWYAHRQKSMPVHFGQMYAIKAYEYVVHPINEDGSTLPNTSLPFFEWKYDWPGSVVEYMDMKLKKGNTDG